MRLILEVQKSIYQKPEDAATARLKHCGRGDTGRSRKLPGRDKAPSPACSLPLRHGTACPGTAGKAEKWLAGSQPSITERGRERSP